MDLFFPLIWAAVVVGVVALVRHTVRSGRRGPWALGAARPHGESPVAVLGRRFASGEIDDDEYWRRMSVLDEHFGSTSKG